MAPYIWPPRGAWCAPGTFCTPRVAPAAGHIWQLHARRLSSCPHQGPCEGRSARPRPRGGECGAVAAVGNHRPTAATDTCQSSSRLAPATQKAAAMGVNGCVHLAIDEDAQGAPSADEPALMRGWYQRRPCLQTVAPSPHLDLRAS